jgi:tetratricopeptide (TPR) repeat protein
VTAYQRAVRLWRTIGDPAEELKTLQGLARAQRDSGDSAGALESLSQALKLSEGEQRQATRAEILRTIATVYFRTGSAPPTLKYATEALEISRSRSDQTGVAEALLIIGDVYYQLSGEFDNAVGAYAEAYGIFEALKNRRGQGQAMLYLAQVDSDLNDFSQAFDRAQQAKRFLALPATILGQARSSALRGHILSSTGAKQEALNLFEEVKSTLAANPDSKRRS